MTLAALVISGRDWLLPAAGVLIAAAGLLVWVYFHAGANPRIRTACFALKLLGFLALLACLVEPLWSGQRAKPGANYFALVADNSQGMQIKDRGAAKSRGEELQKLLGTGTEGWQSALEQNFQMRRYLFDARLQASRDFSELNFDGRASAIVTSLQSLAERFKGQPLAGVLLFTDGNATDVADALPDLTGLPPIYPVVVGRDDAIKDIAVQRVAVTQTSFEDAPVTAQAEVMANGYAGQSILAQLVEVGRRGDGSATNAFKPAIYEQTLEARRDGEPLQFRFELRPQKSGVSFYRLQVSARSERGQFTDPKLSTEATLANNSRVIAVDRGHGPYRILYVSGRPNWEFKFLNRSLSEDDQVELVGLIRVARREPKFEFRGRPGETSNPLFKGFGNQGEETERYDQPVLVRLNTRDEFELRGGFPKVPEDLFAYHAVILDDLEAEFFTRDQQGLLQKFVSDRGGGFLMLGGADSLNQGKYERTPIGDMLPVYLDRITDQRPIHDAKLQLTREGWLQPWARLRATENDERKRIEAMPGFQVVNHVREAKPGASVLASVVDGTGREHPALVAQRFGHGRSAALLIGDMWRWGLQNEDSQRDLGKAWRQMMRWLVSDVPNRVTFQAEPKRGDPNQAMQLQVRAKDKEFQPLDNASVTLRVQPIEPAAGTSTNAIRLLGEPSLGEAGLYEATFIPRETGGYRAEAVVTDAKGVEVGRADVGWVAEPAADEFRSLKPNRALLEEIARKTHGEVINADKLEAFARGLPERKVPVTETWTYPLWHTSTVFLFALGCFIAEWGLRRWKGMA